MATPARSLPSRTPSHAPGRSLPSRAPGGRPSRPPSRTDGAAAARARRRRRLAFLTFSAVLVGALVIGLVQLHVMVNETAFRLEDVSNRIDRLERQAEARRLQVARLSTPSRIAREAHRLGLVVPDPSEVVYVHADPGIADPGPGQDDAPTSSPGPAGGGEAPPAGEGADR